MTKEKPIAELKINKDISKMNVKEWNDLIGWIEKCRDDIVQKQKDFGKCRFRFYG